MYLSQQEQDPRQQAATPNYPAGTVAAVHGQAITKDYLRRKALEQYKADAITDEVLKIILDKEIERLLLEKEAAKQGIITSDSDVTEHVRRLFNQDELTPALLEQGEYQLLKETVSKSVSKTREAFTIGFWLPPEEYDVPVSSAKQREVASQRQVASQVVAKAKQRLAQNEEPLQIARDLLQEYPVLEPILAVNGYLLATTENEELLTNPILYTYSDTNNKNPFFPVLFSLKPGQVKEVTTPSSSGALVIKVTAATDGNSASYEAWLAGQKQNSVQIISSL